MDPVTIYCPGPHEPGTAPELARLVSVIDAPPPGDHGLLCPDCADARDAAIAAGRIGPCQPVPADAVAEFLPALRPVEWEPVAAYELPSWAEPGQAWTDAAAAGPVLVDEPVAEQPSA